MNRRTLLKHLAAIPLLPRLWPNLSTLLQNALPSKPSLRRVRSSDPSWPSPASWEKLKQQVGGQLIPVQFPLSACQSASDSPSCQDILNNLKNPYYVGDQPGLTQTLGWADAWVTKPSVYAVAARDANDIAAAVNFAHENNLRLVVKGGGHSYQGTSNAPDSLLIWTRHMNDIAMHTAFVPQGCEHTLQPQPAVTLGAGTIGMQAYQAVTTEGGKYVQGGGCTTVCLGGLVQGGGFGSFSKHYGTAAGGLLEAEVVTADGQIRVANACTNPDLFWALKGGGGGTYGVVSKLTLRTHDLPEYFGIVNFTVKAASDDAYRRLIREFVSFYHENLFNDHWGEQAHFKPDNSLDINMLSHGLDTERANKVWQPFLDWVAGSPHEYSTEARPSIVSLPAQGMWDLQSWKEHWPEFVFPNPNGNPLIGLLDRALSYLPWQPAFRRDKRPDAPPNDLWWVGDAGQVGWFIWGFESLWLPASLLDDNSQERLANALFASSRHSGVELHFNKGLAGAPPDAIAGASDTAMNPAVLTAFALAIVADAQGPAYPGIPGHEPSVVAGRKAAERVHQCMNQLRAVAGD